MVVAEIDESAPVVALGDALTEQAPLGHGEFGRNTVSTVALAHGDVDAVFARADVVVRDRLVVHRGAAVPLETRGLIAEPDPVRSPAH